MEAEAVDAEEEVALPPQVEAALAAEERAGAWGG